MMRRYLRRVFSRVVSLGILALLVFSGLGILTVSPAAAAIRRLEEAPGQIVYQSRQTVQDQHGNSWQAIAFKRVRSDHSASLYLRLVGFPGTADIDRSRSLTLTNSLGQSLTATDASSQIFTDATSPEPNVGQYDLQPVLSQLQSEIPLRLTLPTTDTASVMLPISPTLIEEWRTLAAYEETK
ncbi:MAG: DUF3122 domain-containing protein [Pseudanabaenales cyanobacterium]|nr:DUF3122 domain-containing protein [Pseudanabaenales cyanobacterium]